MRAGHNYRNKLCEIELQQREETNAAIRDACPELREVETRLVELEAKIEELLAAQRLRRQRARASLKDPQTQKKVKELRAKKRKLSDRRKELRAEMFASPDAAQTLADIKERAKAAGRAERAVCGCHWGTYLLVERACRSFRKGAPPKFLAWRREGRVGVQCQNGTTWEKISAGTGAAGQLQIIEATIETQRNKRGQVLLPPQGNKRNKRYILRLRIGSNGRQPIWAEWPMKRHRPLPPGAKIKWATVSKRLVAGKPRWQVMFTLECEPVAIAKICAAGAAAGIDVGYRKMADGSLRVAYLQGSDGKRRDVRLPADLLQEFARVERIQGRRDRKYHLIRRGLRWWLKHHKAPRWLREGCHGMHAWKRQARLAAIVKRWRDERFAGDERIFQAVNRWLLRDSHLWQFEGHLRDQLLARRKDLYRKLADKLAKRYKTVYIEKLDLRELHDVIRPKDEQEVPSHIRRAARIACLSQLIQCFKERLAETVELPAHHTTTDCHQCGHRNDVTQQLRWKCEQCGKEWDQDDNAARNLLARGKAAK